jgi:hypothetical protein
MTLTTMADNEGIEGMNENMEGSPLPQESIIQEDEPAPRLLITRMVRFVDKYKKRMIAGGNPLRRACAFVNDP